MCSTLEYPDNFLCPITYDIMHDPVSARDGHTYERSAIQRWFDEGKRSSPVTNEIMLSTDLIPNHFVKAQISTWRDQNEGDAGVDNRIKVRFPLSTSNVFVLLPPRLRFSCLLFPFLLLRCFCFFPCTPFVFIVLSILPSVNGLVNVPIILFYLSSPLTFNSDARITSCGLASYQSRKRLSQRLPN